MRGDLAGGAGVILGVIVVVLGFVLGGLADDTGVVLIIIGGMWGIVCLLGIVIEIPDNVRQLRLPKATKAY